MSVGPDDLPDETPNLLIRNNRGLCAVLTYAEMHVSRERIVASYPLSRAASKVLI